jgi:hypothetical protein
VIPEAVPTEEGCSPASHERLKRPTLWPTLRQRGELVVPADSFGPEERIALADCGACGSTLARALP